MNVVKLNSFFCIYLYHNSFISVVFYLFCNLFLPYIISFTDFKLYIYQKSFVET